MKNKTEQKVEVGQWKRIYIYFRESSFKLQMESFVFYETE